MRRRNHRCICRKCGNVVKKRNMPPGIPGNPRCKKCGGKFDGIVDCRGVRTLPTVAREFAKIEEHDVKVAAVEMNLDDCLKALEWKGEPAEIVDGTPMLWGAKISTGQLWISAERRRKS